MGMHVCNGLGFAQFTKKPKERQENKGKEVGKEKEGMHQLKEVGKEKEGMHGMQELGLEHHYACKQRRKGTREERHYIPRHQ